MSSSNAPFGMKPVFHPSGSSRARALANGIASAYNTAIYQYQPVKFTATGAIAPVNATTDDFVGVFMGVTYTDSNGKPTVSNQWIANTPATEVTAYFTDDPATVYEIQADGSVAQSVIGGQTNFSNLTANGQGLSQCTCSATMVTATGQGQLRVVDKGLAPDNDWSDSFTVLRVQVAQHQFVANKVGF